MKFGTWLGLGALAMSGVAVAGPYVGAAGTVSERSTYTDLDWAKGGKFFAGYRFDDSPLMVELAYVDAGGHRVDDTGGVELEYSGLTASVGVFAKVDDRGSGLWLTAGYYDGDSEVPDVGAKESASGLAASLGFRLKLNDWVGVQFGVDRLFSVKDFANDEDMTSYSAGLVFELPGASRSVQRPQNPAYKPAYAPAYSPPPAPAPVPAAELAPPPPPPPMPVAAPAEPAPAAEAPTTLKPDLPGGQAAGGVRRTAQPTMLLRQPRPGAPVDGQVPADAEVQLLQRVPNANGVWWYVSFNGSSGWVSESALK